MTEVVCENGICRLVESADSVTNAVVAAGTRLAQGYMPAGDFVAFLNGTDPSAFGEWSWAVIPLALLGGLAMNLTPCVLPMVPINLMIIGKSAVRGAWYGLGITLAYGLLGVLAALGGMAFGGIQSNPWFNLGVAVVFVVLSLALSGVFYIDFSASRSKFRGGALLMGALSAVLAGACVAPILISVLMLTAKLVAAGNHLAIALPFVLGLGMALPWPFVGAGLAVLPKPGAWMKWVNRGFALLVLGFAVWYARLAWIGFTPVAPASGGNLVVPATFAAALERAERPVLVDCKASWCKNCAAMNRLIETDPSIREALKRFTVIELQAEDIGELRRLPGFGAVNGLPAFVIFE